MCLESQIAGKTDIEKLPENILLEILRYLPIADRCRSRRVCKTWKRILSDNSLWRHVDLLEFRLDLRTMRKIVKTNLSPCLLTLKIRGYAYADCRKRWKTVLSNLMLKKLATRCPNLWMLHLIDCNTSKISFSSLPPSITCIEIVNCIWQSGWMSYHQEHLQKLEHLRLDNSLGVASFDLKDVAFRKNLKYLSLSRCYRVGTPGVKTIAEHLSELEFLNICGTPIDNLAVYYIAEHLKKLKELCLAKCKSVSDEAIASIAVGLPVLNKLDISYCEHITMRGLESLFVSKLSVLIVKRSASLSEEEKQTLKSGFPEKFILIA